MPCIPRRRRSFEAVGTNPIFCCFAGDYFVRISSSCCPLLVQALQALLSRSRFSLERNCVNRLDPKLVPVTSSAPSSFLRANKNSPPFRRSQNADPDRTNFGPQHLNLQLAEIPAVGEREVGKRDEDVGPFVWRFVGGGRGEPESVLEEVGTDLGRGLASARREGSETYLVRRFGC